MNTDRIEKKVLLHASLPRVWRALSDSTEFGTWFGIRFEGQFAPGAVMRGVIVPTTVNAEVANAQKPYTGKPIELTIDRMEPQRLLSFRWHPHALDPNVDYSTEPATLIEFALEEVEDGVILTLTESGFDRIPLARRATAFTANEHGWEIMVKVIGDYVGKTE